MTDPLRMERPRTSARGDDLGDVLASIRRLIAQETAPARADGSGPVDRPAEGPVGATGAGASPQPSGSAPGEETGLPLSPGRTMAMTSSLAEAVEAAAARMADTARRVEAARSVPAEPPFRLNPDALIPAAAACAPAPEPTLRLSPRLSVLEGGAEAAPSASRTPSGALATGPDAAPTPQQGVPQVEAEPGFAALPDTAAETATVRALAARLNDDHAGLIAPPITRDRDEPFPNLAATVSADIATEQTMDAHPLRNLLRDAIRDELRGEFADRLDSDLRRLVREELAAALTEAFGKPAA